MDLQQSLRWGSGGYECVLKLVQLPGLSFSASTKNAAAAAALECSIPVPFPFILTLNFTAGFNSNFITDTHKQLHTKKIKQKLGSEAKEQKASFGSGAGCRLHAEGPLVCSQLCGKGGVGHGTAWLLLLGRWGR